MNDLEEIISQCLKRELGELLRAVVLFGSFARGSPHERSDIDIFVVLKKAEYTDLERRRLVYFALVDVRKKFKRDTTILVISLEDVKDITPLLLNIAFDGKVLFDQDGETTKLLAKIREATEKAGLERVWTENGKYGWMPRRLLKPGEVFEVNLDE